MSVIVLSQEDAKAGGLPFITPKELAGWDSESVDLVMEYQLHGWTGRVSSRGHAIMHAPDGKTTASVGRRYRRKRSAEISRRPLNHWLAEKELERKKRESAFGLHQHDHDHDSGDPPWRIAEHQSYEARLRMHKILGSWWEQSTDTKSVWQLLEAGEDDWAVISAAWPDRKVTIVAIGPRADPERAEQLRAQAEEFNNREEIQPMQDTGPLTAKKFKCQEPGCDRSFGNQGGLNLHKQIHIHRDLVCPLCTDGRVLTTPAAFGRHIRSALHKHDPRLATELRLRGMAPPRGISSTRAAPAERAERAERVYTAGDRACEYCGKMLPAMSIGGHHRGHKKAGHIKIADGGDGATQVIGGPAKAITAPVSPPEGSEAATEAPAKPERVVVQAVPIPTVESVAVNGTGHKDTPQDVLNRVRALINPDLVGELERLRVSKARLEAQVRELTAERNDLQAWKDMMKEAMNA